MSSQVLSSTVLNAKFKQKDYPAIIDLVKSHFETLPRDSVSAGKFLNALAFHLYHNPINEDQKGLADDWAMLVESAFSSLVATVKLDPEVIKKVDNAAVNILYKGFLRDAFVDASLRCSSSYQQFCSSHMKASKLEEFFEYFRLVLKCIQTHLDDTPNASKDIVKLLKDNKLSVSDVRTKMFHLHSMHIEALHFSITFSKNGKKKDLVSNLLEAGTKSLRFCARFPEEGSYSSATCKEKILGLILRTAVALKSRDPATSSNLFEFLVTSNDELNQKTKNYVPSVKLLSMNFWLFDLYLDAGEVGHKLKALELMEDTKLVLLRIEKSGSTDTFAVKIFSALCGLNILRLEFKEMRDKIVKAKAKEKAENKTTGIKRMDTKGPAEEALSVGDTNPYLGYAVSLSDEIKIYDLLSYCRVNIKQAFEPPSEYWKWPQGYLGSSLICQLIHGLAEFSKLFCHPKMLAETVKSLAKFAQFVKSANHQNISNSLMLRHDLSDEEDIDRIENMILKQLKLNDDPDLAEMSLLTSLAWFYFESNQFAKASEMCGTVFGQLCKLKNSTSVRLISAELKYLATLLRCGIEASQNLSKFSGGWKDMVEESPLELIYEAFKDVVVASNGWQKAEGTNLNVFIETTRASSLHKAILSELVNLYVITGLPKEMRLYGKIQLDLSESISFVSGTAESLLLMAEIDLNCDDPEQAMSKLMGVRTLLGHELFKSETTTTANTRGKRIRSNRLTAKSEKLAASPLLFRTEFTLPDFLGHEHEGENVSSTHCYPCSTHRFGILVFKYFNLLGVTQHQQGQLMEAIGTFDGAIAIMKVVQKRILKSGANSDELFISELFKGLQSQVECFARSADFKKCRELLADQKQLLFEMPSKVQKFPIYRAQYYHQFVFVSQKEKEKIIQVSKSFQGMALSPLTSRENPRTPSNFRTPIPKTKNLMPPPAKPLKKLLPPP